MNTCKTPWFGAAVEGGSLSRESLGWARWVMRMVGMGLVLLAGWSGWEGQTATHRVEQAGTGDFRTIQAAVSAAAEGDTVVIGPGVYEENVEVLDKSLVIRGVGPQYVTVKSPNGGSAFHLTSRGDSSPRRVEIQAMKVTAPESYAVVVRANYEVRLQNLVVADVLYGALYMRSTPARPIHVANCTFVNIGSYVLDVASATTVVRASIFSRVATDGTLGRSLSLGGGYSVAYCLTDGKPMGYGEYVTADPKFLNPAQGIYFLRSDSPARHAAPTGAEFADPDGTVGDLGAYGGPGAAAFWPYVEKGPIVRDVALEKVAVRQGDKVKLNATVTTR